MRLSDAKAKATIKKWIQRFEIDPFYKIRFKVNNVPDSEAPEDLRECNAYINVDASYGNCQLIINAYTFDAPELDFVIAHEIGHIVLIDVDEMLAELAGPRLRRTTTKMIENANERFAKALMRVKKGSR